MTYWIFIISNYKEPRFKNDLDFACNALKNSGVSQENIKILSPFDSLDTITVDKKYNRAIIVTIGHGNQDGLLIFEGVNVVNCLTPKNIISFYESNLHLTSLVLVLGHCYAGIFKYLDLKTQKPLCILSASSYEVSKSSDDCLSSIVVSEENTDKLGLNTFLMFFFKKLELSIGTENQISLLDLFSYCSCLSNQYITASNKKTLLETVLSALSLKESKTEFLTNLKTNFEERIFKDFGIFDNKKIKTIHKLLPCNIEETTLQSIFEVVPILLSTPIPYITNPKLASNLAISDLI